ncbi:MAG TPA: hypothetical protein VH560_16980 [Polyangia bacterium]|nr:hypothetical protein [Polyangia bacterium]
MISLTQQPRAEQDEAPAPIALHPEDISELIEMLEEARRAASTSASGEPPTAKRLKTIR